MNIIAVTQKGPQKIENEDRVVVNKTILSSGVLQTDFTGGILAVADGVGGNNAGAVASHFVAMKLTSLAEPSEAALTAINQALLEESSKDQGLAGMATTLSAVFITEKVSMYHVGNTRVYSLQNGKYLKQLSSDDTKVNYLLATGQLTPEEAETYDKRNVITACMGGGKEEYFQLKVSDISEINAPAFLMTSDGVHEYVSMDEIEDTLDELGFTAAACSKIIEIARANGSTDDASILLGVM